jgi:hypothetical protein
MIKFTQLQEDHPDLSYSPLLRAAHLTLSYVAEHGPIGLTKTKAFKRSFVHWAAEHFDWPGSSQEALFRYHKVLNESDFPPLELLHFLLVHLKLGRHYKGDFMLTKRGKNIAGSRGALFQELIPIYLLDIDHAAYGRFDGQPFGTWDVWLNVMSLKVENGSLEKELYGTFYDDGADWNNASWRSIAAFVHCVLKPLEWSGLISAHEVQEGDRTEHIYFKTPLWRSVLKLETDNMLTPAPRH